MVAHRGRKRLEEFLGVSEFVTAWISEAVRVRRNTGCCPVFRRGQWVVSLITMYITGESPAGMGR